MFRTPFLIALSLAIAFGLGVPSVWWALDRTSALATLSIAEWSAEPFEGTSQADPYSRARAAREARLPLGHAEGIAFFANRDRDGTALRRNCNYVIEGPVPPARFYTIHARDTSRAVIATGNLRAPALHSGQLLRHGDGTATIHVGPDPVAGNWLPLTGSGPLQLVLTLYDTPVVASATVGAVALPSIRWEGCDG